MDWVTLVVVAVIVLLIKKLYAKSRQNRQLAYIKKYHFQQSIKL